MRIIVVSVLALLPPSSSFQAIPAVPVGSGGSYSSAYYGPCVEGVAGAYGYPTPFMVHNACNDARIVTISNTSCKGGAPTTSDYQTKAVDTWACGRQVLSDRPA
jgi:hypothetical protein